MYLLAHLGLTVLAWEAFRRLAPAGPARGATLLAVAVGALLPDLVDKPLGHLVLGWGTGRLFAHTALFALLLGLAAWLAASRGWRAAPWAAALAFGTAMHLALDATWEAPAVLAWPLLGPMPHGDWDPARYATLPFDHLRLLAWEAAGAAALAAAWALRRGLRVTSVKKPTPVRRER